VEARRAGSAVDVAEDASGIAKVGMGREPKVGRISGSSLHQLAQAGRADRRQATLIAAQLARRVQFLLVGHRVEASEKASLAPRQDASTRKRADRDLAAGGAPREQNAALAEPEQGQRRQALMDRQVS